MLADLSISNLGVITSASAELSSGLTVLTGETGAGKTMVVTGLRLLSGGRADASRVRSGAERALVEGSFVSADLGPGQHRKVADLVEAAGGVPDDNGEFLVARSVTAGGRSKAYLGGKAVPAATLKEFSEHLLTIHGQNDQLRLLAPEQQLAAIDRFDESIAPLVQEYREAYKKYRALAKDLRERTKSKRELAQEVDRLTFAVNEIEAVDPREGEDEELLAQIRRLQSVDTLREQATEALTCIDGPEALGGYGEEDPASTLLGRAAETLRSSSDVTLRELGEELTEVSQRLSTVSGELGSYLAGLPVDPGELDTLLHRQQDLKSLTRKYAPDATGVVRWLEKAKLRLSKIDTSTEALEKLAKQVASAQADMEKKAARLSKARGRAAGTLAQEATKEIRGLAMPKARLEVSIEQTDCGPYGADSVEILLAPNDSTPGRPLAASASGGELSRVMLALEVILSSTTTGETLVFDEVDAGVGGRAAVEIGRRLARLAQRHQVIVVTHLPQVAAYADTHLHVAKHVGDDEVTSGVLTLSADQRVEELARMLAGLDDTETGRAHAQELFDRARAEVEAERSAARA
ncbi:DNA repair protein RecN [Corynebacterium tapiri]|uniref:DNA repair protein RecN n=1 Tax=Corynebacterium tapiri TaxID=1448266 RepID=A0A5C4U3X2_9CORY|nr:DNA repair protein RecN [Corynebacterium tapiri]TNL97661.1 DNA repair protein RecN [Corynebacterium tapiri]